MSAEQVAIAIAPIVTAGIASHQGINVEKHWVGKHTLRYNAALLAASMIPVFFSHFIFLALAIYCGLGIAAMKKYGTKNEFVMFLFGNKSLGAIGLWVGLTHFQVGQTVLSWIYGASATFDPILVALAMLASLFIVIHALGKIVKLK
ncbi:MAG TPA: hypothetical protein VF172_01445 [Nitrososphaera sp.]